MYKYMDEVELNISAIKNIKMIHFYHLMRDSEMLSAAMVMFDSDKMINLCSLDKHYDEFISMIFMVYEKEAGKRKIMIDPYTETVLNGMKGVDTGYYEEFMKNNELLEKPHFYHQSYMPYIAVPVIKYVLEQMYSVAGKKIYWNPLEPVWFGRGTLTASFDSGEKQIFPFVLACEDAGEYSVIVGNFFENRYSLELTINYGKDGIEMRAFSKGAGALCNMFYKINSQEDDVAYHCDITLKDKPVYNENGILKAGDKWPSGEKIDDILGTETKVSKFYKLPWGQYISVSQNIKEDEKTKVKSMCIGYNAFAKERNNALVFCYDEVSSVEDNAKYVVNNSAMDIFEEKVFGQIIQIYCLPCGFRTRGFYKDKMADKYFTVK